MPFSNCYAITRSDRNKVKCQSDARGWQQALNSKVQIHQQNNLKTIKCRQVKLLSNIRPFFFRICCHPRFFLPPIATKKVGLDFRAIGSKKSFAKHYRFIRDVSTICLDGSVSAIQIHYYESWYIADTDSEDRLSIHSKWSNNRLLNVFISTTYLC